MPTFFFYCQQGLEYADYPLQRGQNPPIDLMVTLELWRSWECHV